MLSSIFFLIRVYLDFWRIKGFITKKVSQNFIIANFFQENKRVKRIPRTLSKNNQTFTYEKGLYMVEKDTIWYDHDNHPNAFYLKNIPNPIKFGFSDGIKDFLKAFKEETMSMDKNDLSFSSETLALFKKDKIFEDLSRDPNTNKLVMILLGLVGLSFLTIILLVIFGRG